MYLDMENNTFVNCFFDTVEQTNIDLCLLRNFKKGEILIKKDEPANTCMLILSGKLRVYNEFPNGRNYLIGNASIGAIIGEMESAAAVENYTSTVEAVTPVTVMLFSREVYNEWMDKYKAFAEQSARRLGRMLCEVSNQRGENIVYSSELTLALLIERLYKEVYTGQEDFVVIRETRDFMSDKSGFSKRSINRAIAKFKEAGIISSYKGKIVLDRKNYKKLMDFIRSGIYYYGNEL